jgi:hypothetical protein
MGEIESNLAAESQPEKCGQLWLLLKANAETLKR